MTVHFSPSSSALEDEPVGWQIKPAPSDGQLPASLQYTGRYQGVADELARNPAKDLLVLIPESDMRRELDGRPVRISAELWIRASSFPQFERALLQAQSVRGSHVEASDLSAHVWLAERRPDGSRRPLTVEQWLELDQVFVEPCNVHLSCSSRPPQLEIADMQSRLRKQLRTVVALLAAALLVLVAQCALALP